MRISNLYYAGRTKLPPDETNGNTPLVSTFEVAWYSWKETKDARLPDMIAAGEVKNMIDLCYQTLALADIDRGEVQGSNREKRRAHSLACSAPTANGRCDSIPKEPEVEFQTGHALWALCRGRHSARQSASAERPRLPAESPAGFRRLVRSAAIVRKFPHAVPRNPVRRAGAQLVLSGPGQEPKAGTRPRLRVSRRTRFSSSSELDRVWDGASPALVREIEAATRSNDVLIRQAAAEALGRLARSLLNSDADALCWAIPSKLVQRTAAWSLRQIYSRHQDMPGAAAARRLVVARTPACDGGRRASSRIISPALARRNEMLAALEKLSSDPVIPVRMDAIKGSVAGLVLERRSRRSQPDRRHGARAMAKPQHPWITANLERRALQPRRRKYPLSVQQLGSSARRRTGSRARDSRPAEHRSTARRKNRPRSRNRPRSAEEKAFWPLSATCPCAAAMFTISARICRNPRRWSTAASATTSSRSRSSAPARTGSPNALLPLLDSPDPEMRRLAERASPIVRGQPISPP